jgi:hypothetical protein
MRPVSVFANGPVSEIEQLEADLRGRWRQAARAVMVLLSAHGLPPAQIAALLDCHPGTVRRWISRFNAEGAAGLADRPRCGRPALGGQPLAGRIAALLARPGRRCAADFIALLDQVLRAFPQAPVIVVICDNDSIHHARTVTAYLEEHPRLELLYGARYSPHGNPVERIWAALKNYSDVGALLGFDWAGFC